MLYPVSTLDELAEYSSFGFEVQTEQGIVDGFLVKTATDQYLAYKNHCPHQHLPLNWNPHQFLDKNNELIVCAMHLALFELETGQCVAGPCTGKSLTPLSIEIRDRVVWLSIES
ncbi:Rieske (2Fe-2S) protein [Thiofilum flexile]|uniref:Rieske (2Fe-2S) protein n=1 Tax=Thiofilum flexile TaxID=125627 RepID=UPI000373B74D|nr:Rieske (2Fe-2S) protein [Thiofilum flexile]